MERTVAKCLLEIKSIFFGFKTEYLSSEGFRLPLYCDNRLILSYPRVRKVLSKWLGNFVKEKYPEVEMIIGTAVAGISFGVILSESLGLPMGYVLESKKDHGFKNRVEGIIKPNAKVVVVDDVIFTGNTITDVVKCLKEEGCQVLGGVSIFSYELPAVKEKLDNLQINYNSLTNLDVVALIGMQTGKITYDEYLKTLLFKENPFNNEWLGRDEHNKN